MISSKKGQEMYASVTPIYENSVLMKGIFNAIGSEADNSIKLADEVLLNIFPQTADSWGLTLWEERLKIVTNISEDIEKRRKRIITRLQTKSIINPEKIGYIIGSLTGLDVDVIDKVADYIFGVTLISNGAFNVDLSEVISEIKRIKPSHMGYSLALENQKSINISTTRTYALNSLNMCGQFNCGDGIVISAYGRSYEATLKNSVGYSTNIKDYALTGAILPGTTPEPESGIATIGRVYAANENIKAVREYLYDNQLSKTDGDIIGALYNPIIKAAGSYNNSINDYEESGNDLTGEFMTGSTEESISTLGRLYESNENIEAEERIIFDTQLNKSSSIDPIVGSLNSSVIEADSSSEEAIKDYSLTGSILVSENINNENGDATIAKTYSSNIQEDSNETDFVKEYNQAGNILTSTEVLV